MSKPAERKVFSTQVDEDIWRECWCRRCFQPNEALRRLFNHGSGCPIFAQAQQDVAPPQWDRGRGAIAAELYHCAEFLKEPAVLSVPKEKPLPQEELFSEPEHDQKWLPTRDAVAEMRRAIAKFEHLRWRLRQLHHHVDPIGATP
jgi:hypothetical protein